MKKDKLKEAKTKELPELKKDLDGAKLQLAKLRLEIVSGKSKNTRGVKTLRRDIAQILTIIKEKNR